jgi:hypothetical protein
MKKLIKSLLLFIPLSIGIYVILIALWGNYAPYQLKRNLNFPYATGYTCSRIKNIADYRDVDILFLGSSHTYSSFDPRFFKQYGLTTFNLGSTAQSPMQTQLLLKRYLDDLNPKLIVYDVYPEVFRFDGVESAVNIIVNDKNDLESIKMALTLNHIKVYNALIYGFYRDIFKKEVDCSEELTIARQTYIDGGFVETELLYFEPEEFPEGSWQITDRQVEYFEGTLQLIKERNIPVILVQTPITQAFYKSISNNSEFDDRMRKYGLYYNFNGLVELKDELHFYDYNHLNQDGVKIFSAKLMEILLKDEAMTNIR